MWLFYFVAQNVGEDCPLTTLENIAQFFFPLTDSSNYPFYLYAHTYKHSRPAALPPFPLSLSPLSHYIIEQLSFRYEY